MELECVLIWWLHKNQTTPNALICLNRHHIFCIETQNLAAITKQDMIPHLSRNIDPVNDLLSVSLLDEAGRNNTKSTSLLEQRERQEAELDDLPLNKLILEDPEKLSEANELRWGATSKKSLGDSLRFDELSVSSFLHDSFNSSTTTTFSASSTSFALDEDVPPRLPIRRTISFADTVQVREFDVILGDDRLCKYPMTLSWKPSSEHCYNIHEREMERLVAQEQKHHQQKQQQQQRLLLQTTSLDNDDEKSPAAICSRDPHQDVLVCHRQQKKGGGGRRGGGISNGARRLNARQRRLRLRSFGYSNNELLQSLRKRKIRLSLDYAYGHQPEDNLEAARSFQDEHFRYII